QNSRALIANLTLYYPYPNPNRDRRCSLIHHCIPPFPNLQCELLWREYWRWLPDDGAIAIIARPSGCRCVTRASIIVA
ncbi:hypothetical protein VIGAN_02207100, partial [Vigna angularis var. angularis]